MKKILTIVISVALVAAIAVGGTLAYLSSNAKNTTLQNTFTTTTTGSKLDITLTETPVNHETGIKTTGTPVTENSYPIIPGETMDKDPTITVLKDSSPCYVFAYVSNNATFGSGQFVASITDLDNTVWLPVDSTCPGLYVYADKTGSGKIVPTPTSDTGTALTVFTKIKINSDITQNDYSSIPASTGISVKAYAHQASTTGDATYDKAKSDAISWYNTVKVS